MKIRYCFVFCLFLLGALPALRGQEGDCSAILRDAQRLYEQKRLESAQETLRDVENCDYQDKLREARQVLQKKIFEAIQKQKESAEAAEASKTEAERKLQATLDSLTLVLANLEKANAGIVKLNLDMAENLAAEGKYEEAVNRIETARTLNSNAPAVRQGTEKLCRRLLAQAGEDLDSMEYRKAAASIKLAERLKVLPDSVRAASLVLQHFLFENARRDIEKPRYMDAADKMDLAEALGFPADTIAGVCFEIAFCLNEIGQIQLEEDVIRRLARLLHKPGALLALGNENTSNHAYLLQELDAYRYEIIRDRYFAQSFRRIEGGTVLLGETLQGGEKAGGCAVPVAPFEMAEKEVTFYEFYLFCKATRQPYSQGTTPSSQGQRTNLEGFPSNNQWGGGQRPVIDVSWFDAIEYCNWRSRIEGLEPVYDWEGNVIVPYEDFLKNEQRAPFHDVGYPAGKTEAPKSNNPPPSAFRYSRSQSPKPPAPPAKITCNWNASGYRLPTEAEWEFAAGNGTAHTHYAWGNEAPAATAGGNVADVQVKSNFENWQTFSAYTDGYLFTAPTGSFAPNTFGLYDLSGNVWEWCWDWYRPDYCDSHEGRKAFYGPASGHERALRGGAWSSYPDDCRVRRRFSAPPDMKNFSTGFRLVRKAAP